MLDGWFKFKWTIAHFKGVLRLASKICNSWGGFGVPYRYYLCAVKIFESSDHSDQTK